MRSKALAGVVLAFLPLSSAGLYGCDGCRQSRQKDKPAPSVECSVDKDCTDDNPCTRQECRTGSCATLFEAEGTSCDNATVCDGVSKCDAQGNCKTGPAPVLDDGNACTTDSCDPVRGVTHEASSIDDFDECTRDACDPRTGHILHDSVDIDDGNDCTFDSCDPKSGVSHKQPNPTYTCSAGCGEGFHAASRAQSASCGSKEALQTFCTPNCGRSFYSCDAGCPQGYVKRSENMSDVCGSKTSAQIFCVKN